LYECGLGTEEDLAKAFGRHVNSVQKYLKDFAGEGILGLISERRGPQGRWKLTPELRGKILHIVFREGIWKLKGIEQRLGYQTTHLVKCLISLGKATAHVFYPTVLAVRPSSANIIGLLRRFVRHNKLK
jgi:Winged helix-turn helix